VSFSFSFSFNVLWENHHSLVSSHSPATTSSETSIGLEGPTFFSQDGKVGLRQDAAEPGLFYDPYDPRNDEESLKTFVLQTKVLFFLRFSCYIPSLSSSSRLFFHTKVSDPMLEYMTNPGRASDHTPEWLQPGQVDCFTEVLNLDLHLPRFCSYNSMTTYWGTRLTFFNRSWVFGPNHCRWIQ
jgi:hypothetical protein